jgi:hypothetical protein
VQEAGMSVFSLVGAWLWVKYKRKNHLKRIICLHLQTKPI